MATETFARPATVTGAGGLVAGVADGALAVTTLGYEPGGTSDATRATMLTRPTAAGSPALRGATRRPRSHDTVSPVGAAATAHGPWSVLADTTENPAGSTSLTLTGSASEGPAFVTSIV